MNVQFEVYPSTSFDYDNIYSRKRKAGEKLKPGPRPTKRPRKYQPRNAPTRLRKDRPLQTQISHDIWENILIFCPLDKLLKIRGLCKTFHSTLSGDRVWKQARLNQFGPTLPDPPEGMTEMEYADLLVAERLAKDQIENYPKAKTCIPYAMYDSWNHYQWAGTYEQPPSWTGTYGAQTQCYSRFDIKRWNDRYNEFMETSPSTEDVDAWFAEQKQKNEIYMAQLQKIEAWVMEDVKRRVDERAEIRLQRADFFKQKAVQLDPVFPREVLELCPSYEKSAAISKLPSEKSWQILLEKVLLERETAEVEHAKRKREKYHQLYRVYLSEQYDHTRTSRQSTKTKEQRLVLELADQVIHNLLIDPEGVHDHDIVNIILRNVYNAYQRLPEEERPSTRLGPYRLIMDDARLVYRKKIAPLLRRFKEKSRGENANILYCPYSSCDQDEEMFHDFERLMEHIAKSHPRVKNIEYLAMSFHMINNREEANWFCLEWPRNLPMKAGHQPTQLVWDLDADEPYKATAKPGFQLLESFAEALEIDPNYKQCQIGDTTVDTVLQAAFLVGKFGIDAKYKTNVALEFIRSKHMKVGSSDQKSPDTEQLLTNLTTHDISGLFKPHRCMRCRNRSAYSYHSFATHTFADLLKHYFKDHMTDVPDEKADIQCPDLVNGDSEVDEDSDDGPASLHSTPNRFHCGFHCSTPNSDDVEIESNSEDLPILRRFMNPASRVLPQPWSNILGTGSF